MHLNDAGGGDLGARNILFGSDNHGGMVAGGRGEAAAAQVSSGRLEKMRLGILPDPLEYIGSQSGHITDRLGQIRRDNGEQLERMRAS